MIVYCGLRHFYMRHFPPPQPDSLYILTHNGQIWDFSPELKQFGFTQQTALSTVRHFAKPVHIVPIELGDFYLYTTEWLDFSLQYTDSIEVEYPHAWYVQLPSMGMCEQFCADFAKRLPEAPFSGIWGGGESKIVAKLAAHNLPRNISNRIIFPEQTGDFLKQIPIDRLPLPEVDHLQKLGINTVGQLADFSTGELGIHFGQRGAELQKIAHGEDLTPFQARRVENITWEMDFTTKPDLLRPLYQSELSPYLIQGADYLAQKLSSSGRAAGALSITAVLENHLPYAKNRTFKEVTNNPKALERAARQLLPNAPTAIAALKLTVDKIRPAPTDQLSIFHARPARSILPKNLPTQIGIKIPRRERVLEMWKELFL